MRVFTQSACLFRITLWLIDLITVVTTASRYDKVPVLTIYVFIHYVTM